jgi:hypothetical protein
MNEPRTNRHGDGAGPAPAAQFGDRAAVVHLFRRVGAGYCVSTDRSGSSLPPGLNGETWTYVRDLSLAPGERRVDFDTALDLDELERVGYFLIGGWYEPQ